VIETKNEMESSENGRSFALSLLLVLFMAVPGVVEGQSSLEGIAERAMNLPQGPTRKVESMRFGTRGTTLYEFSISKSDPNTLFMASKLGFVFATNDGGISWKEGRLISRRSPFFGSIRPNVLSGSAPFSSQRTLSGLQSKGFLKSSLSDSFSFPYKTTNYQVLDFNPEDPAYWKGIRPTYFPRVGDQKVRDSGASGGGGDAARLGVGLKMSAKRLGGLLRKRGKKPAGMNLQLLLTMRGSEPTGIQQIAIHPTQPDIAFAATDMGLYKTSDGGYSWLNAYPGRNLKERKCLFVSFHPEDASRVYVGTGQGLLFSTDGGQKFQRFSGTQLSSLRTNWLEFHPQNSDIIYAGTNVGAFRTDDGGENWRWIFYETLNTANYITSVALDPKDFDRVTLSTRDGLFRSRDGGKNWERSGALMFTSIAVDRIVTDPLDRNHLIAMTYFKVWESFDWGETWQAMYIDDGEFSPRAIQYDPHEPKVLWMLTSNELLKITTVEGVEKRFPQEAEIREIYDREPRLSEVVNAVLKAFHVHQGERSKLRRRGNTRWLLPRLNVFGGILDTQDAADLEPTYLGNLTFQGQKHVLERSIGNGQPYGGVMLVWNLRDLVFDMEELTFGRVFSTSVRAYHGLKFEVDRLYEERKRLIAKIIVERPTDRFTREALMLRLEELTAHLNALSGGQFESSLQALEQGTFFRHAQR